VRVKICLTQRHGGAKGWRWDKFVFRRIVGKADLPKHFTLVKFGFLKNSKPVFAKKENARYSCQRNSGREIEQMTHRSTAFFGGFKGAKRSGEMLKSSRHRLEIFPVDAVARAHTLYFARDEASVFEFFQML